MAITMLLTDRNFSTSFYDAAGGAGFSLPLRVNVLINFLLFAWKSFLFYLTASLLLHCGWAPLCNAGGWEGFIKFKVLKLNK